MDSNDSFIEIVEEKNDVIFISETEKDEILIDLGEKEQEGKDNENSAENNDSPQVIEQIPTYDSLFTGFLTEKEFCMETGKHIKNDARPRKTCFNCLGDHNLNECPEKHNAAAISRNRKNILGNRTSQRYHQDADNKFGHYQPGKVSAKLRHALGLRENEAPRFIYRMREIGYPLGWLKEAEVVKADVSLIDGEGKELLHPEEEEGETDIPTVKYELEKLIKFPGFNVPFPSHIREESQYSHHVPRMRSCHSMKEFERYMKNNRATKYKRKKLKASDTPVHSIKPEVALDMDVEGQEAETSSTCKIEVNVTPLGQSVSPVQLSFDKEEGEVSDDDSNGKKLTKTESSSSPPPSNKRTLQDENSDSQSSLETKKKRHHHRSQSKGFNLGVPLLDSITSFKALPSADKWAVDICDHIDFENLPDALGAWNKMKGLVSKVKKKMDKLHAED